MSSRTLAASSLDLLRKFFLQGKKRQPVTVQGVTQMTLDELAGLSDCTFAASIVATAEVYRAAHGH